MDHRYHQRNEHLFDSTYDVIFMCHKALIYSIVMSVHFVFLGVPLTCVYEHGCQKGRHKYQVVEVT